VETIRNIGTAGKSKLISWLANGETGISSKAIVNFLVDGKKPSESEYPHDPSDLRRCVLLLESVPELEKRFRLNMRKASPNWAALCDNWNLLMTVYRSEENSKVGPQTYQLMKILQSTVRTVK
jgi:hypothetical protein